MSGRATPKRVAPLPARCARQMFFVADYDAVCAIMTTSLFLSPASSLSIYLAIISLPPPSPPPPPPLPPSCAGFAYPGVFRSVAVDFFLLSVSFSVSHRYLLPADEDKLCSCLSRSRRRRLGHAKRRPSSFLFLATSFSRYIRVPVGFSDSPSLAFCFISLTLFRFLYVRLPLSDS